MSSSELLRFAEYRFEPIARLMSDYMKSEQILDLASGNYDKIELLLDRSLMHEEKYQLRKCILQSHLRYSHILDEFEYIIQRRLNEQELRRFVGNQYDKIAISLGKSLTEKQIRNILYGKYDHSLVEVENLLQYLKRKYDDDYKRTQYVVNRLIDKLDQDHNEFQNRSKSFKPSSPISPIQPKQSDTKFHRDTMNLFEQLSDEGRKHVIAKQQDNLLNSDSSEIFDSKGVFNTDELKVSPQQSIIRQEITRDFVASSHELSSSQMHEPKPIKAFEHITRTVKQITDEERIEEIPTMINTILEFQEKLPKRSVVLSIILNFCFSSIVEKSFSQRMTPMWLSNLDNDTTISYLPIIKSAENETFSRVLNRTQIRPNEDIYLGWSLFKSIDHPDLGLREERPIIINVKHIAQTYVIGIPEEYTDLKSKGRIL